MTSVLLLVALAYDGTVPPADSAGLTAEQRAALQADLHTLAVGFGVEPAKPDTTKTMAEVSDRALGLLEKSVSTVAAGVEKGAPQVWRVAIRQQYAKAIALLIAPLGWFLAMLVLVVIVFRKARGWIYSSDAWQDPGAFIVLLLLLAPVAISGGILLDRLTSSVLYLVNPEWYALRDLVQLLLGKPVT